MIPKVCFPFVWRGNLDDADPSVNHFIKVFVDIPASDSALTPDSLSISATVASLSGRSQNPMNQARTVNNYLTFISMISKT